MFLTKKELDFIEENPKSEIIDWDRITRTYDLDIEFLRKYKEYIKFFSFFSTENNGVVISSDLVIRLGNILKNFPEKKEKMEEIFIEFHEYFWSPVIEGLKYNNEKVDSYIDVFKQIDPDPSDRIVLWFKLNY